MSLCKKTKYSVPTLALVLSLFFLGSCFAPKKPAKSPFLGDTTTFKMGKKEKNILYYQNKNKKVVDYEKFIFDPVLIYQSESGNLPKLSQANLIMLGAVFQEILLDTFGEDYETTEVPGEGVLRIRFAIRGLKPGRYYMDNYGVRTVKVDSTLADGTFEMEAIDSINGERILALVNNVSGEEFRPTSREESHVVLKNIRDAFTEWAQSLKKTLDEAKAKKTE